MEVETPSDSVEETEMEVVEAALKETDNAAETGEAAEMDEAAETDQAPETDQSVEPAQPAETDQAAEPGPVVNPAQPDGPGQSAKTPKTVESPKTAETPKTADTPKTAETSIKPTKTEIDDPFAYLNRDSFTSEKYKIELRNLPKYYGFHEIKKLINVRLKLGSNKIKCPNRNSKWCYACFRDEESKRKAISTLNGFKWKGKKLEAMDAKPVPDPLVVKRNIPNLFPLVDEKTQEAQLKKSVIPYWDIPYEDQLKNKQQDIAEILTDLGNEIIKFNPDLKGYIEDRQLIYDGLPCELLPVRHAEEINGYRNKCEFTVGMDGITNLKTVGFRLGSYVSGFTGVAPIHSLLHINDKMKMAVTVFEKFVRASKLEVYNTETHTGHFKQLTVRMGVATGQLMLIVGVNPRCLSKAEMADLKDALVRYFAEYGGKVLGVTSLYFHVDARRTADQSENKLELLMGQKQIVDIVMDLKFNISPEAFFQVNTKAANVLFESVIELVNPTPFTTIVDICCGTGTIGICLAKKCRQVYGLEVVTEAVEDARANCKMNNIYNCEFFNGKAEEILFSVMSRATTESVIAIVDPPRAGLHINAIMQLRKMKKLNKLVYLSCNPKAASKNFLDLARAESKTMHGNPFVPVKAVPVDMFPYTKHCELLIYFERVSDDE